MISRTDKLLVLAGLIFMIGAVAVTSSEKASFIAVMVLMISIPVLAIAGLFAGAWYNYRKRNQGEALTFALCGLGLIIAFIGIVMYFAEVSEIVSMWGAAIAATGLLPLLLTAAKYREDRARLTSLWVAISISMTSWYVGSILKTAGLPFLALIPSMVLMVCGTILLVLILIDPLYLRVSGAFNRGRAFGK